MRWRAWGWVGRRVDGVEVGGWVVVSCGWEGRWEKREGENVGEWAAIGGMIEGVGSGLCGCERGPAGGGRGCKAESTCQFGSRLI